MSESFVHALDWSPPGLGKHRRSVLAVLTSNHVLSIWECVGKPEIATDWVRACVVNHALQAHYKEKDSKSPGESEPDHFERLRAKQRIRAFAWSPAIPDTSLSGASGDRGEVLIIKIQAPHDILDPDTTQWSLSVAASFALDVPETKKSALSACMPVTFKWRSSFVDQLAWSPWGLDSANMPTSILTFTSQVSLQCTSVKVDDERHHANVAICPVVSLMDEIPDTQAAGCIRWVPKLNGAKEAFLVYPTRSSFYCLQAQPGLSLDFHISAQDINTPWDEIAGVSRRNILHRSTS
jgi:hypothetical protein